MATAPKGKANSVKKSFTDPHANEAAGQTPIDFGIRQFYNPSDDQKEMIKFIYQRYVAMRSSKERIEAEKVWEKSSKQWEAYRDPRGPDDWQSNHYVPLTTSVVETALSEVIDQSPKPLILPRGSEDAPKAQLMQHIFEYTWDQGDGDTNLYKILKDVLIYGTGIAQEYYWRDARTIMTDTGEKKVVYSYDNPYLEPVPLNHFFIDENARDFVGPYAARDCIRRYIMDIDDFKAFFKGNTWDSLGNAKYVIPGGETGYYEWYKPPTGIDHSRQVEVLWYWAVRPHDWLCIVANDVMVVMGPNPYKHKELPFARAVDLYRPHKFYGKGEAELLESIQDETNTLRRMIIDRNHLDIDKMFFVSSRLNLSDEDTIARPHGMIPVDDINSAKPIEYGDIPRSVELSLGNLQDDATITTGINPRSQALPQAGTATEAAILKESTLKRIRLKMRLWEKDFLVRIGRLRLSNILQYFPTTKIEKIIGEEEASEYQNDISSLIAKGLLSSPDDTNYSKKYQKIPIQGKKLEFDMSGNLTENSFSGTTFFELRPEYFVPSQSGYDIKFEAGSTLPVSKPLMQSKASEMYDRLIQLAVAGVGYDPVKLGDMLLKVNDYNPNDYHKDNQGQNTNLDQMVQAQIGFASQENKLLMDGKAIAPKGTPYVNAAHTKIHVEFTSSPSFQALKKDDPRVKLMTQHIVGELASQEQRAGLGNPPQQDQNGQQNGNLPPRPQTQVPSNAPTASLGGNPALTSTVPSLIQGGGMVPQQ